MFQQLLLFTLLVPDALAADVAEPCRCPVPGLSGYWAVAIGAWWKIKSWSATPKLENLAEPCRIAVRGLSGHWPGPLVCRFFTLLKQGFWPLQNYMSTAFCMSLMATNW